MVYCPKECKIKECFCPSLCPYSGHCAYRDDTDEDEPFFSIHDIPKIDLSFLTKKEEKTTFDFSNLLIEPLSPTPDDEDNNRDWEAEEDKRQQEEYEEEQQRFQDEEQQRQQEEWAEEQRREDEEQERIDNLRRFEPSPMDIALHMPHHPLNRLERARCLNDFRPDPYIY